MVLAAHDEFVAVDGIAREVHDALTGRSRRGNGAKDSFELVGADARGEQRHQKPSAYVHGIGSHPFHRGDDAGAIDVASGQRSAQVVLADRVV